MMISPRIYIKGIFHFLSPRFPFDRFVQFRGSRIAEKSRVIEKSGEPPRARTGDTRLKRAVLCQLS